LVFCWTAIAGIPADQINLNGTLGLSGYDPISYFAEAPFEGDKRWSLVHEGAEYRFVSPENMKAFASLPDTYLPAYGGWCAYAMLDGDKVEVDLETFKIVDGKLYLFYNGLWGDTLKRWNKKVAKSHESDLIEKADQQWIEILKPEA
jgi:YHS domain-containing protein